MKFQSLISIPSISSLSLFLLLLVSPQKTTAKQVRSYNLTISQRWQSDFGRPVFVINDQSPGPVLEADEGDEFEILVDNQLAVETTLHWHGIYQVDRPWNDGVPGVTQYSIQPRDTYTYRFTIQGQYGIYFYHGHFGPAFADGMRGPIWIRPAAWRPRPYTLISSNGTQINGMKAAEERPFHIVISDWNAEPMDILLIQYRDTGFVPWCSTAITLNNKGRTICHSANTISESDGARSGRIARNTLGCQGQAKTEFTNLLGRCKESFTDLEVVEPVEGEEWVWINFIHSGAHHELQVSVDEHEFYVVAADGEFVHPQKVVAANVNLGERISILVHLNQKPGDYAIRVTSLRQEQMIVGFGILRYPGQMHSETKNEGMQIPQTKPWVHLNGSLISPSSIAMDETKLHPYPARPPPQTSDNTLRFFVEQTGTSSWALNIGSHQAFRQQLPPLLWHKDSRGKTTYTDGSTSNSQYETGKLLNGTVVDIVFENGANVNSQHPFHKHNHKAFIIGTGSGYFQWKDVAAAISEVPENFNLVDPPIRDGCRLDKNPGDWTVVRYEISFPAASMLHCHMIHHFAAGQQVVILEGIEAMESIPEEMENRVHSEFRMPIRYGPLD